MKPILAALTLAGTLISAQAQENPPQQRQLPERPERANRPPGGEERDNNNNNRGSLPPPQPGQPTPLLPTRPSANPSDGAGFQQRLNAILRNSRMNGGESQPLVVAGKEMNSKTAAELEEDLSILGRLMEKAAERAELGGNRERGPEMPSFARARFSPQQLTYIEGYGVLVQLPVRYPLAPLPGPKENVRKEKPVNSEWEQARRELRGGGGEPGSGASPMSRVELVFEPDRVENLKKSLVEAMRNAANIRHLKPDDCITLVVTSNAGRPDPSEIRTEPVSGSPAFHPATLTLRVKISDASAAAAGKLEGDAFRGKVQITQY
ncbi:MAG TPA: hypothetical protein VK968_05320 [Roseimicrobium sp.]|nr:hypothetical protein [Roseimicrobium sp.]